MAIRSVGLPRKGQFSPILKMRAGNTVVSIQKLKHGGTLRACKHAVPRDAWWRFAGLAAPRWQPAFVSACQPCPACGVLIAGGGCPSVFVCSLSQRASHCGLLAALRKLGVPAGIACTRVMRECTFNVICSEARKQGLSLAESQGTQSDIFNGHYWCSWN